MSVMDQKLRISPRNLDGKVLPVAEAYGSMTAQETPRSESEKKKQLQSRRRQQRQLPLSEVYSTVEAPAEGAPAVDMDLQTSSMSPTAIPAVADGVIESNAVGEPSKAGSKKRKLIREPPEDSERSIRSAAKKGKRITQVEEYSAGSDFNFPWTSNMMGSGPLPLYQYAAKFRTEEPQDPDDPWSLDGPWVKKEPKPEKKEEALGQASQALESTSISEAQKDVNPAMAAAVIEEDMKKAVPAAGENSCIQESSERDYHDPTITAAATAGKGMEDASCALQGPAADGSTQSIKPVGRTENESKAEAVRELTSGGTAMLTTITELPIREDTAMVSYAEGPATCHTTGLPAPVGNATVKELELVASDEEHTAFKSIGLSDLVSQPACSEEKNLCVGDASAVNTTDLSISAAVNEKLGSALPCEEHAPGETTQTVKSMRTPAASKNTGAVDSVWKLATGRKTRSVGAIGDLPVTNKRPRSVAAGKKQGSRGPASRGVFRENQEDQWVDVPLDWRNEKSGGKKPQILLSSGKTTLDGVGTAKRVARTLESVDVTKSGKQYEPAMGPSLDGHMTGAVEGGKKASVSENEKGRVNEVSAEVKNVFTGGLDVSEKGLELQETVDKFGGGISIGTEVGNGQDGDGTSGRGGSKAPLGETSGDRSVLGTDAVMEPKERDMLAGEDVEAKGSEVPDAFDGSLQKDCCEDERENKPTVDNTKLRSSLELASEGETGVSKISQLVDDGTCPVEGVQVSGGWKDTKGAEDMAQAEVTEKSVTRESHWRGLSGESPGIKAVLAEGCAEAEKLPLEGLSQRGPDPSQKEGEEEEKHVEEKRRLESVRKEDVDVAMECFDVFEEGIIQSKIEGARNEGKVDLSVQVADNSSLTEEVGKADGEPKASETPTNVRKSVDVTAEPQSQEASATKPERTVSNTEKESENLKDPSNRDGEEEGVPNCECKKVRRAAVINKIDKPGDANIGVRYWSCINRKLPLVKKRKQANEAAEESCTFFRWLDTPRALPLKEEERRKERYRQVELQRLL